MAQELPAAAGVKTTLNVALLPGAITRGRVRPEVLKPVPEKLTFEIVTLPIPVLLSRIDCEFGAPMTTFPKLALVGVAESDP